jgi:GT2 family glycosyltransferase
MKRVLIGLLSYNDLHFLKENLGVIEELRRYLPAEVMVMEAAGNEEVRDFVKKGYPKMDFFRHPEGNVGYGRAWNTMLKRAFDRVDEEGGDLPEFFLLCTSDVFLDLETVKLFVQRMQEDESIAMCAGKLHYWDEKTHRKTRQIDSLGIAAERRHHFVDRAHGEEDKGQYDDSLGDFFGLTGAAFLIRVKDIEELSGVPWQLFDERMWMYKEDIDLAYRMRWLGKEMRLFPEVWAWHARSVANKEGQGLGALARADEGKRDYGRMHSYANHILLLKNHLTWRFGFVAVLRVLFYEILKGAYLLLRHPRVFLNGMRTLFFVPGKSCERRISAKQMWTYF